MITRKDELKMKARRLSASAMRQLRRLDRFLNRHPWVMPAILVALVLPVGAGVIKTVVDVSDQQKAISDVQTGLHDDQLAACYRGNKSRRAQLIKLQSEVTNLSADRDLLRVSLPPGPLRLRELAAKNAAITATRAAIAEMVASQATVAVRPGSVTADCLKAYPAR